MKLPLTVLHDTGGSNSDEEENSHDNVVLFEKSLSLHTSGLLVVFACKGTVKSNASSRLVEIDYPFADTIWLRTVPYWHDSLEQFHWGDQVEVLFILDFCVLKCNWVDTGQKCNLLIFLSYGIGAHKICDSLALSLGNVIFFGLDDGVKHDFFQCIATLYTYSDNEKYVDEFDGQHKLSPFTFAHAANFLSVTILARAVDPCVWDPGIHFEFRALTSNIYGVLETVEWAAHQRLPHGLVPMDRFGGMRVSNTIHRCFKVNISVVSKGIDINKEWNKKGIAATVSCMCRLLLVSMTIKIPYVAANSASISASASISLGEIFWCIVLLDTSHIIKLPSHVIPKVSKNYATMSRLLQAANQIMMLFLHRFACSNQAHYTPSFQMTFPDSNLEDKVLFGGGCIVVNQASSIKAYELEVVDQIGPSKMLECFIWDPGPISIWLKGRMSLKGGFMHIEENVCHLLFSSRV
ncbi:hypothetical protein KY290_026656 [Solanum tuberosum]|uniref:Uncharacterized protein n=1 Tax=Solanum tuberosum TaxID=4113 RepID=A0ABQ7UX23_SOLTU|nr:hypothetical protein KY290_026656 [Solanum tuberosum]